MKLISKLQMDLHDLNALKSTNPMEENENKYPTPNSQHPDTILSCPQLPPRDGQILRGNTTGGFGNFSQTGYGTNPLYNSYSNANTSSYFNGYSQFGGIGMMNNSGYGLATNNSTNSFLRAAEENSRSAFQSIESVVGAFSAVAAMFESTYFAVYNSFRAVVGVADQFYRLKTQLASILSAFALVRYLRYLLRKLIRILKLGKSTSFTETEAWGNAVSNKIDDAEKLVMETRKGTNWPLIMFFGVVFGGPWLIWKILSSIEANHKDDSLWMIGEIDHFIAVSEYDFDSVNVDELSFKRGQRIIIAPKEYQPKIRGWLLGSIDGKTQGIMPANYLKILGKKTGENLKSKQEENPKIRKASLNMDKIFENKEF